MKMLKVMLAFVASLALFVSCAKDSEPQGEELVTFTLGYRLVDSNSMYGTKAIANEEVLFAITQCLPESVNLVFKKSGSSSSISVTTGTETTLTVGTYTVTGTSYGDQVGDLIGPSCCFTNKPYLTFNTTLEIVAGTTNYTVNGTINSFAIVADYDEVSTVSYYNNQSALKTLNMLRFDNMGLIFCQGTYTDVPLRVILTPFDATKYKETTFGFSTNSNTTKYTYAQVGKFYKLHPVEVGDSGPVIGYGFPNFTEGTVKTD